MHTHTRGKLVPQRPAQLVVVHLGLALACPPQTGHLVGVLDDKLPVVALPGDDVVVLLLPQQLQDEVPQLDLSRAGARLGLVGPVWEGEPWGGEEGRRAVSLERQDGTGRDTSLLGRNRAQGEPEGCYTGWHMF